MTHAIQFSFLAYALLYERPIVLLQLIPAGPAAPCIQSMISKTLDAWLSMQSVPDMESDEVRCQNG